MRLLTLTLVTMLAALAVAACGGSSTSDLTGKTWQLTAITEKTPAFQGVVPAADQGRYTVTFNTDGTFTATADCNSVSGKYNASGSNLTMTPGPSTLVACPEGSYGDLFAHALSTAASYSIANGELTIGLKDGGTLTFVAGTVPAPSMAPATPTGSAAAPSPDPALTAKAWQLTAVTEKTPAFQGVVPADQQASYTVQFQADGTFQAKADCNQVLGSYVTTADGGLTMTPGPSTLVACPEGSLGDLFVLGLSNAASYAIAGDELTITLVDQGTLVFK